MSADIEHTAGAHPGEQKLAEMAGAQRVGSCGSPSKRSATKAPTNDRYAAIVPSAIARSWRRYPA